MTNCRDRLNNQFGNFCYWCQTRIKNPSPQAKRTILEDETGRFLFVGFICSQCEKSEKQGK